MTKIGQYFVIVNKTKKEYIDPENLNGGSKLWEICANNVSRVLPYLLRQCTNLSDVEKAWPNSGEGGENAGRWAGDEIVVIGDYCDSGLYGEVCGNGDYTEISDEIRDEFNEWIDPVDNRLHI